MVDYRALYDRDYVGVWDLGGKARIVTIERVEVRQLIAEGGRTDRKPVLFFVGHVKGLVLNKTNGRAIAAKFGPETDEWVGRRIALYPSKTEVGREEVDCIRVRPVDDPPPAAAPGEPPVDDGGSAS
ncbi:MAG: hypothetical protein WA208_11595 [Thermoanaerobaculia bacterium]